MSGAKKCLGMIEGTTSLQKELGVRFPWGWQESCLDALRKDGHGGKVIYFC